MNRAMASRESTRNAHRLLALVAGAALAHGPVCAQADVGLPFPARIAAVVPQGGVAGMQVSIAQFVSAVPAPQALASARQAWSEAGRWSVVEGEAGGWRTLSRHQGGSIVTLQIRPARDGGSVGLISRWTAATAPSSMLPLANRLLPPESLAPRVTESRDPGTSAVSLVSSVAGRVDGVRRTIAERARQAGLSVVEPPLRADHPAASGSVLLSGPGSEGAVTLVQRGPAVGIVVHLREVRS